MSDHPPASPQTVRSVLEELVQTPVPASDIPPLAELATALRHDVQALRAVEVGDAAPAFHFEASEP